MKGNKNSMEMIKEKNVIENFSIFIVTFTVIGAFIFLLKTSYYMTFFYFIFGIAAYIFTTRFGKEYYLFLCIPEYFISVYMDKAIYNFEYFGLDGLNIFKLHPITIILLVALFLEFMVLIYEKKLKLNLLAILGVAILIIYSTVTYKNMGQNGMPLLLSNYFEPIMLFTYYYAIRESIDKKRFYNVIKAFLIVAAFVAFYGIIEYLLKFNIFSYFYSDSGWYGPQVTVTYRILTTIGNPLTNAFTFLTCMVVVNLFIKNTALKNFLLILFSLSILATGSRSMFLMAILLMIFNYKKVNGKGLGKEIILKAISIITICILVFSPLGNTFLERLDSQEESTEARIILIDYFVNNLKSFKVHGLTYGTRTLENVLKTTENHNVIPENPYILLFIDLSYLSLLYFIYLLFIIIKLDNKSNILVLLLAFGTYNSFSVKGTTNSLFFYILILSILYKFSLSVNNSQSKNIVMQIEHIGGNK